MNAHELRIGNFVKETNVWDYDSNHSMPDNILIVDKSMYKYEDNDIQPIELTEEWLLKFGFLRLREGFEFWDSSVFNIEFMNNHWYICYLSKVLCTHIKNVHQLQNLYFALTGDDLTIQQ